MLAVGSISAERLLDHRTSESPPSMPEQGCCRCTCPWDTAKVAPVWTHKTVRRCFYVLLLLSVGLAVVDFVLLPSASPQLDNALLAATIMCSTFPLSLFLDILLLHWTVHDWVRRGLMTPAVAGWWRTGHGPLTCALWAAAIMTTTRFVLFPAFGSEYFLTLFRLAAVAVLSAGLVTVRRLLLRLSLGRVVKGAMTEHLQTLVHTQALLRALFVPSPSPPADLLGDGVLEGVLDMEVPSQLQWAEEAEVWVHPPVHTSGATKHGSLWPIEMIRRRGGAAPPPNSPPVDPRGMLLSTRGQAVRAAKTLFKRLVALRPASLRHATAVAVDGAAAAPPPPPPTSDSDFAAVPRTVTLAHLEYLLGTAEAGAVMSRMDSSGDGELSMAEFSAGVGALWEAFANAQGTLAGRTTVSSALSIVVDTGLVLVFIGVSLAIFDSGITQVLLPLSAVLLAVSFAVGPSLSRLVASLTFVLAVHAYDVGDRVMLAEVGGGVKMDVLAVGVVSTTFRNAETGVPVVIGNDVLAGMPVANITRATTSVCVMRVKLPASCRGAQLQELREWLAAYCKAHPAEWGQGPNVFVEGVGAGEDGTISIMLWLRFLRPPSQGLRFAAARTDLWMALTDQFKAWQFHFARPTVPITTNQPAPVGAQ